MAEISGSTALLIRKFDLCPLALGVVSSFVTKNTGGGSGLGLGVTIGFEKQPDKHLFSGHRHGVGPTTGVLLSKNPTTTKAADKAVVKPAGEPAPRNTTGGEVVLIVEDDPYLRELVVDLLLQLDYRVLDAGDGQAALEILERGEQIDLLLSDVVLPGGILGPDIAAAARASRPDLKIMYMSGYTDDAELDIEGQGAKIELLRKPFKLADLGQRLRRLLDR